MKNETKKIIIASPLKGKVIPITEVPDPVFSNKMVGDGCAIIPENGKIYSPINGKVVMIAPTKHALGLKMDDGVEILPNGIHFTPLHLENTIREACHGVF